MIKNLLGLFVGIFTIICGRIDAVSNDSSPAMKVYVASDQLVFSDYGIFVLLENAGGYLSKIPVSQVNWDTNGLFVSSEYLPDPQAAWLSSWA